MTTAGIRLHSGLAALAAGVVVLLQLELRAIGEREADPLDLGLLDSGEPIEMGPAHRPATGLAQAEGVAPKCQRAVEVGDGQSRMIEAERTHRTRIADQQTSSGRHP